MIAEGIKLLVVMILSPFALSQNWDIGVGSTYDMKTTVLLGEISRSGGSGVGDVGFQITAKLQVLPLWKDPSDPEIVLVSLKAVSPQLWIKSRKAPEPEGFVEHSSRLVDIPKDPILILFKKGQIIHSFAVPSESLSSLNFKRGIASAFQYKLYEGTVQERDASGLCNVTYTSSNSKSYKKVKDSCKRNKNQHSNPILGVELKSNYVGKYDLTGKFLLEGFVEDEKIEMSLVARPEAKTAVSVHRTIQLLPNVYRETPKIASTYTEVINKLESKYVSVSIETQHEYVPCPESGCASLDSVLENNYASLESSALGTAKSASAFLKLVPLIRNASAESLAKILKSPRYHDILPQLYDLFGSASTPAAHQAAMKILRQDELGENTERYLWALSVSPFPDPVIIKDILKRSEETLQNDKVSETLALTAAAMAKRYGTLNIVEKVKDSLELGLYSCSDEPCKIKFLRALGNLGSKSVIPVLVKHTNSSSKSLSVIAWKSLASYSPSHITEEIKDMAMKNFLQLTGQKLDSSVRTLALNVILQNDPTVEDLKQLLKYLVNRDSVYEVKKYLLQRLQQLAMTDVKFRNKFQEAIKTELIKSVNYNTLGVKGLSTAFTRNFLNSAGSNGTLVTIQEINSGLLKRGVVNIVLENENDKYTFFSLGLFAGGLNSFVSSSNPEENDVPTENEVATAGMELSFLDIDIRPFVFFSGQGELMGHVWSGTASERTPAFQTTVNLHRHREIIPLNSGFVVEIDVEGAISFDLAGQIQLSLWSRNAKSLVEMEAGIAVQGSSKILTSFVQSSADFILTLEPKLELATDVDFSGPVSLCMRLAQPQTVIKHHIYKVERIPGSRHRLRKTRRSLLIAPGRSYLLNSKNNEMCSKIFDE